MTTFYADTSVLLKLHVDEPGARWTKDLIVNPSTSIVTTELSLVEMYSAFNRLVREGRVTPTLYDDLTVALQRLFLSRYVLIPIAANIMTMACSVLERHPLRAYDSVHLASAIFANQGLLTMGKTGLTFLSADHRLLTAAAAEGLSTFDPATAL